MEIHTLCFGILDSLKFTYKENFEFLGKDDLKLILKSIFYSKVYKQNGSHYFDFENNIQCEKELDRVYNDLIMKNYCVINQFNKYYTIAFSIDYGRFWIWSRNEIPKIIEWKTQDFIYDNLSEYIEYCL